MSEENPDRRLPKKVKGIMMGEGVPEEIREALGHMLTMHSKSITEGAPVADYDRALVSMSSMMDHPMDYGVGDIVRFKVGLNHTRITNNMIVREVKPRDQAVRGTDETSYNGYCDLQNVVVGVIVVDGKYYEFMVDGRRIEKVPAEELSL